MCVYGCRGAKVREQIYRDQILSKKIILARLPKRIARIYRQGEKGQGQYLCRARTKMTDLVSSPWTDPAVVPSTREPGNVFRYAVFVMLSGTLGWRALSAESSP